jgi:uncharacterized membrane protein
MRANNTSFTLHENESLAKQGDRYWGGFAVGAVVGTAAAAGAIFAARSLTRNRDPRILRFEESIQIARPVEDVFRAWSDFARLPDYIPAVRHVEVQGLHSFWSVYAKGKQTRWEAETVQLVPNEAIAWKSVSGPKHTGRITFSPLEDQTIVHVTMNYASPLGRFSLLAAPASDLVTSLVNEALRDFKAALEGRSARPSGSGADHEPAAVGWRAGSKDTSLAEQTRKHPASVDYTRPPKSKYP